jgi:hypothetical protein
MPATKKFTDTTYGYSVRLPIAWMAGAGTSEAESSERLSMSTPNNNRFIISVYRLPQAVASQSEFEPIGQQHVDPVVSAYVDAFSIVTIMGEKKENKSDQVSMRFWQGTSGIDVYSRPAALLSLHAIRYGSDLMVNIVYLSYNTSLEEVREVDALMDSLSFGGVIPGLESY